MAQPNVMREPSMEEILASIRRIIESNEPISSTGLATMLAEPAGFSGAPANDDANDDIGTFGGIEEITLTIDEDMGDAFVVSDENVDQENTQNQSDSMVSQSNLDANDFNNPSPNVFFPEAATIQPAAMPKSLSLADVAARVRAASERNGALRHQQQRSAEEPARQNPLMTARMAVAAGSTSQTSSDDMFLDPSPDDVMEINTQPAALLEGDGVLPLPMISPAVGQQISRSFDDLASAVELSNRRTLDEISTELLRPMLKEWLDDNLPTLVEHLVREEIERVARGPCR